MAFAQPAQINISQDLVSLGIASQNAVPFNGNLDTRPLLQAAVQYASSNGVSRVTADPGAYFFLTSQKNDRYLILNQVSDLTIDLQGADIYLKNNYMIGFDLENCQRVTLANFNIDYLTLPYTQVQVTAVNNRAISYSTLPGWPSPTTLRSRFGGTEYWGIAFRNGVIPANTNRLPLATPANSNTLIVNTQNSPWTQPAVLTTYQAGDVMVVTLKDGDAPVLVEDGDGVVLTGIDIYAAGTLGIHMNGARNSTIAKCRIMPRPGTDRLISTNADGLHLSFVQSGNLIQSNYITRTMDDGIAVSSAFVAFVDRSPSSSSVVATRNFNTRIPNGTPLAFINPVSGQLLGSATLVGQNPAYDAAPPTTPLATYYFDNDLPGLQTGFGIVFAANYNRGSGTVIEKNIVEDILFARGIFLGGVSGVTVQKNTVRRTNCGGIVLHQDLSAYPSAANQDVVVDSNTVDSAIGPTAVGTGAIAALGSIFVLTTDSSFIPLTTPTATNITITNNYITNSGRTGIWAGNIDGGTIQGNTFGVYNLYPQLALWGVTNAFANQLTQDFIQALVVRASRNVSAQKAP